jgi:hypothetical protein
LQSIMTQSGPKACAELDKSTRLRADRLARATGDEMQTALALLSMLDPEAFEIAFTAVPLASHDDGDDEPIAVCRECGSLVAIFPDRGLRWLHFRGDSGMSGAQQVYEPGHAPGVTWILPYEDLDDL